MLRILPSLKYLTVTAAALVITLAICAPAGAVTIDASELAMVKRINVYRTKRHLRPVRIDRRLTRTADWMAADMTSNDRFAHIDSLGRDPFIRMRAFLYPSNTTRGENLAAGYRWVIPTFRQWRYSPAHNANMLDPEFRAIGIARVYDPNATYGYYWVTEFGSKVVRRVR